VNTSPVQSTLLKKKENNTGQSHTHSCKSLGFCRGIVEVSILLGCGTISLGEWCPVFQDNIVLSSSRAKMSTDMDTEHKAGWTSELVWILWRTEKSLAPAKN
jgi:hypothetical protein